MHFAAHGSSLEDQVFQSASVVQKPLTSLLGRTVVQLPVSSQVEQVLPDAQKLSSPILGSSVGDPLLGRASMVGVPLTSGDALGVLEGDGCNYVKSQFSSDEAGIFVSEHNAYRTKQISSNMVKLVGCTRLLVHNI